MALPHSGHKNDVKNYAAGPC